MEVHERRLLTELPNHAHADWRLIVVLEGAFEENRGRGTHRCDASSVILRAPFEEHRDLFRAPQTRYASMSVAAHRLLPTATKFGATALSARLDRDLRRGDVLSLSLAEALMLQILGDTLPLPRRAGAAVRRVRDQLARRYAEPMRISTLAAETGQHPATLARAFREAYGCNPTEFLVYTRVRHARRAIAARHASFARIALECGFYDQSHLTNAMRRLTGMTPRQYAIACASLPSKTELAQEPMLGE